MYTVDLDPIKGIPRFIAYSHTSLLESFTLIPLLIGMFAAAEVIVSVERIVNGEKKQNTSNEKIKEAAARPLRRQAIRLPGTTSRHKGTVPYGADSFILTIFRILSISVRIQTS